MRTSLVRAASWSRPSIHRQSCGPTTRTPPTRPSSPTSGSPRRLSPNQPRSPPFCAERIRTSTARRRRVPASLPSRCTCRRSSHLQELAVCPRGSRREPLHDPPVGACACTAPVRPDWPADSPIAQPVVQPALPSLPELDRLGPYPKATPEVGDRYLNAVRPVCGQHREAAVKFSPRSNDGRLAGSPGTELGVSRADTEVRRALLCADPGRRAVHDHLAVQCVPGE